MVMQTGLGDLSERAPRPNTTLRIRPALKGRGGGLAIPSVSDLRPCCNYLSTGGYQPEHVLLGLEIRVGDRMGAGRAAMVVDAQPSKVGRRLHPRAHGIRVGHAGVVDLERCQVNAL